MSDALCARMRLHNRAHNHPQPAPSAQHIPPFCIPHSAFRILHSAFRIPHSAFCIPHFASRFLHSAFCISRTPLHTGYTGMHYARGCGRPTVCATGAIGAIGAAHVLRYFFAAFSLAALIICSARLAWSGLYRAAASQSAMASSNRPKCSCTMPRIMYGSA